MLQHRQVDQTTEKYLGGAVTASTDNAGAPTTQIQDTATKVDQNNGNATGKSTQTDLASVGNQLSTVSTDKNKPSSQTRLESVASNSSSTSASSTSASIASASITPASTTAASSLPATSTAAPPSSSSGLSDGAVAGIAVACIVGGLILGIVGAFLLFRRRNRRDRGYSQASQVTIDHENKGGLETTPTGSSTSPQIQLNQFLLSATPDKDIQDEMQSLCDLIHQHIENNYEIRPVSATTTSLTQSLRGLGYTEESGLSAERVAAMCLDSSTRVTGLRHVIAHVLFKSIDFNSRSSLSLLPAPVADFLQSMPNSNRNGDPEAVSLALAKWRTISAFLLHPQRETRTALPLESASVEPQTLALAKALNTFLAPFVQINRKNQRDQFDHLTTVAEECAKLGYVLLSHPSDWQFTFGREAADAGEAAIVCAGLSKVSHQKGKTRTWLPRQVFAPVVVQL